MDLKFSKENSEYLVHVFEKMLINEAFSKHQVTYHTTIPATLKSQRCGALE